MNDRYSFVVTTFLFGFITGLTMSNIGDLAYATSKGNEDDIDDMDNTDLMEDQREWRTYENPDLGFNIEYPADLVENIEENEYDDSDEIFLTHPEIQFIISEEEGSLLDIDVARASQFLDTDTLTLKTRDAHDYLAYEDLIHTRQNEKDKSQHEKYPVEYIK